MSNPTHTKGPWQADVFDDLTAATEPKRISITITSLWTDDEGETHTDEVADVVLDYADGIAEANARLLAAAPELLEACKRMIHEHEYAVTDEEIENAVDALRTAVATAEGA